MEEAESHEQKNIHTPVLTQEILKNLNIKNGSVVIDATANGGGHTTAMAKQIVPGGKLLAIEWDGDMIGHLHEALEREGIADIVAVARGNFKNIEFIAQDAGFAPADAVLFDLGMSSFHVDLSKRGFTFRYDEPLDMRYSADNNMTAADIVNTFREQYLYRILKTYGDERYAERIARAIVGERKKKAIDTTFDLVAVIERAVPQQYCRRKIHCATKTFQSLRIFVNDELENIRVALERAYKILRPGGRMGAISFHSLEDKIVKNFGREKEALRAMRVITKKPIVPAFSEKKHNRRSRSAKLRIFEKIS